MNSLISLGRNKRLGFTLIELMVTLVLMAIVMSLATMALSQFSGYADKSGRGFEGRMNQFLNLELLRELLGRSTDYYVRNNIDQRTLFYQGSEKEIWFVSGTAWGAEYSTLNILRVEDDKLDASLEDLVLYQRPLSQEVFFNVNQFPEKPSDYGIVVLDGAKSIEFDYLGINNIRQIYPSGTSEYFYQNLHWQDEYRGDETGYLPSKVRMTVEWPNAMVWPAIFDVKALNLSKRGLMLGGTQ